ncbi:Uncharacterised protein [Bordetella pertussis]|nr:Uncharacterised protein [Bordetella pertussis]
MGCSARPFRSATRCWASGEVSPTMTCGGRVAKGSNVISVPCTSRS